MYFLGVDIGSISTKAVLLDETCHTIAHAVINTGISHKKAFDAIYKKIYDYAHVSLDDIDAVVSTGYGRKNILCAKKNVTEITAHATGAYHLFPATRMVIDIGGQDTKVIAVTPEGKVDDFVMNDKCAAGTGRFLEVMAHTVELSLEDIAKEANKHTKNIRINSTCTVFAESEIISLIAREETIENISYAIHASIVDRVVALAKKVHAKGAITLAGGVSKNGAIQTILSERLLTSVQVPSDPQIVGALGAALLAQRGV